MSIEDYAAPFMLEGSTINTTVDGKPAVSDVHGAEVQRQGLRPGRDVRRLI